MHFSLVKALTFFGAVVFSASNAFLSAKSPKSILIKSQIYKSLKKPCIWGHFQILLKLYLKLGCKPPESINTLSQSWHRLKKWKNRGNSQIDWVRTQQRKEKDTFQKSRELTKEQIRRKNKEAECDRISYFQNGSDAIKSSEIFPGWYLSCKILVKFPVFLNCSTEGECQQISLVSLSLVSSQDGKVKVARGLLT